MLSGDVIVSVFKSDAVIWWAAIFRTTSTMFDKMLHLSKSQGSVMSRLRSHDHREAISNLLTVSMHLQDSLSRFHRQGLQKIRSSYPRGECVDSHPCVSRVLELLNCPCTAQSSQVTSGTSCSIGLSLHLNGRSCSSRRKEMLKKARQENHGSHPTILSRWYEQEG